MGNAERFPSGGGNRVAISTVTTFPRPWRGRQGGVADRFGREVASVLSCLCEEDQLIRRFPEFTQARLFIGQVYKLRGQYQKAIEQFRQARTVDGDYYLVQTLALAGRTDEARALLADLIEGQPTASVNTILPSHLASYYLALGDTDGALDWLERAYDEHWFDISFLRAYPSLKPLHPEPRFQALVEKLGLPDEPAR